MGDEDPKQLVRWIGEFSRNQTLGNIGRMSSESSHLTYAGGRTAIVDEGPEDAYLTSESRESKLEVAWCKLRVKKG